MATTVIAGRYRLDRLLGSSRMSEVWLADDLELGRPVALKLLAPEAATARFEREGRAVAALGHPNVTQLFEYGEADGRPFMVFEYLGGGTLEELLRERQQLPDELTLDIARDVAAGLAHAHSRGVVHRDLKPANVLFDGEGRAKLSDFGIARLAAVEGTLTEAKTVLGTAAYISPEQAAGLPAGPASDVYSLGVMLYRMLSGRLPFESDDPFELIRLHRDAEPPPLTEVRADAPPLLAAAVTAMLAKDPVARPADGSAVVDLLDSPAGVARTGEVSPSTDVTMVVAPTPLPPTSRMRRRTVVGALLLALAFVGAAAAWEIAKPAESSTPPPGGTNGAPRPARHVTRSTTSTSSATTAPATTRPARATTTGATTTQPPTTTARRPTTSTPATTGVTTAPATTATTVPTTSTTPTTSPATTTTPTSTTTADTTTTSDTTATTAAAATTTETTAP